MIVSDNWHTFESLRHGGELLAAAEEYHVPIEQWQDLSTGVSPWSWPVPKKIPGHVWRSLPDDKALRCVAADYYQCSKDACFPVAGSQVAIRTIPQFLPAGAVAVPGVGYQEHRLSWQLAGHHLVEYNGFEELLAVVASGSIDYTVVINPNNPTADVLDDDQLVSVAEALCQSKGLASLLVVDEAFADCHKNGAVALTAEHSNIIVLRSMGKFFGLAGLRVGFVIGQHDITGDIEKFLSPWQLSTPAIYLGVLALQDTGWQTQQRQRLLKASEMLVALCENRFPNFVIRENGLFVTVFGNRDELLAAKNNAAKSGILLRYDVLPGFGAWLRVGLADDGFARLRQHWMKGG